MNDSVKITAKEFGDLFSRFKGKYISIALSYVRNIEVAEDIVSESFTAFWDNRHRIELKTIPEAYILQSVKNRCLNHLRDKAVRMRAEEQIQTNTYKAMMVDIEFLSSEDLSFLFHSEIVRIFKDFLSTLPDQTRDIFVDSRFRGLTYNEIAMKYGVTPRKVKRDIVNVLHQLRVDLKDYIPIITIFFSNII